MLNKIQRGELTGKLPGATNQLHCQVISLEGNAAAHTHSPLVPSAYSAPISNVIPAPYANQGTGAFRFEPPKPASQRTNKNPSEGDKMKLLNSLNVGWCLTSLLLFTSDVRRAQYEADITRKFGELKSWLQKLSFPHELSPNDDYISIVCNYYRINNHCLEHAGILLGMCGCYVFYSRNNNDVVSVWPRAKKCLNQIIPGVLPVSSACLWTALLVKWIPQTTEQGILGLVQQETDAELKIFQKSLIHELSDSDKQVAEIVFDLDEITLSIEMEEPIHKLLCELRGNYKSWPTGYAPVSYSTAPPQPVTTGQLQNPLPASKSTQNPAPPLNDAAQEEISEDCAELSPLDEASVLRNLCKRYDHDLIYTYSGLFLLAINPYKRIPLYTPEMINIYRECRRTEVGPHIFSVSDEAYRSMLNDRQDQSILLTGESGAGKTENAKKVIQYIAFVACRASEIEQLLLECNPLLEAFGNAKTNRNDNSSRFSKFIKLQFNSSGTLLGATINSYLLEKSRIIWPAKGERSFHIFYQLAAGASAEDRKKFLLDKPEKFCYLNASGCTTIAGVDDVEEFKHTVMAMKIMNFRQDEIDSVFRTVSGILWLGNVEFESNRDAAEIRDKTALNNAAQLWGVDAQGLELALIKPRIKIGRETVQTILNKGKAEYSRNTLAEHVYAKLFDHIVMAINRTLEKENQNHFIGILDIAGFEILENNSFEQLCVNYTNERLQQFFYNHMFKIEQEEYIREQINWTFIDLGLDLQDTIKLIDKKPVGILALLDEESFFPKGTDETFLAKVTGAHLHNAYFKKPKFQKGTFRLAHYAGEVEYDVKGWLEKNRDPLQDDLIRVIHSSVDKFVVNLLGDEYRKMLQVDAPNRFLTVASQYKEKLNMLMDTLHLTSPHFVCCIIPNLQKQPGKLVDKIVLEQLRCNGVLEGIRISCKGFPNRIVYAEFVRRYCLLHPNPNLNPDHKNATVQIIKHLKVSEEEIRFGMKKIFFKAGTLAKIKELREQKVPRIEYFSSNPLSTIPAGSQPPAPAISIELFYEITKFLEHALGVAAWITLAQYLGVEAYAIPSQAGGNTAQFWARLRAKEHFYADLELGCAVSDDFRNAVAALEFPGKQQLLQKIHEFRTRFCAAKPISLVVIPTRGDLIPGSIPRMAVASNILENSSSHLVSNNLPRGAVLKRSSFNSLEAALEHLHNKIDAYPLSFTKRKTTKSDATQEVKRFWRIQEIFSMILTVDDDGDVAVDPQYIGDLEATMVEERGRTDQERTIANTEWNWVVYYLVRELRDVGVAPAKETFILIGEKKLFLSGSMEETVRNLLHKLRDNNRLHRVPIVLKYTLEDKEHVREIITKLQSLEYWKDIFFTGLDTENPVSPNTVASRHQLVPNSFRSSDANQLPKLTTVLVLTPAPAAPDVAYGRSSPGISLTQYNYVRLLTKQQDLTDTKQANQSAQSQVQIYALYCLNSRNDNKQIHLSFWKFERGNNCCFSPEVFARIQSLFHH